MNMHVHRKNIKVCLQKTRPYSEPCGSELLRLDVNDTDECTATGRRNLLPVVLVVSRELLSANIYRLYPI